MKVAEIFSCYVADEYSGGRQTFERAKEYFTSSERRSKMKWKLRERGVNSSEFIKGHAIFPTFNYSSELLQVKVRLKYSDDTGSTQISVGNSGFPFECWMSRRRYSKLLAEITSVIV